jgi:hypothetical protein
LARVGSTIEISLIMLADIRIGTKDGEVSTTTTCMFVKFILNGEDDDILPFRVIDLLDLFAGGVGGVGSMVVVEVVVTLIFVGADKEYMASKLGVYVV